MSTTKTVALSESAYERLSARKREGESFSDVVERLAGERSLLEIVGTGSPEDGVAVAIEEARASMNTRTEEFADDLADALDEDERSKSESRSR
jgi:predicted CopG family antitoxin